MQKILCCIFVLLFIGQLLSPFSVFSQQSGMRRKKNTAAPLESVARFSQDKRSSGKRQSFFKGMSGESSRCEGPETIALDSNYDADLRHLISANSKDKRSLNKRQSFFESISEHAFMCHDPENDDGDPHEVIADMVRKKNHDSIDEGIELHQVKQSFENSQDKRSISKRQCFFQSTSNDTSACHDQENDDGDLDQALADMVWKRNHDFMNKRIRLHGAEPTSQNFLTSHKLDTEIADSSDNEEIIPVATLGGTIFGQASYQQTHTGRIVYYNDAGDDVYICSHCTALFWSAEALKRKEKNQFVYTHCCEKGQV